MTSVSPSPVSPAASLPPSPLFSASSSSVASPIPTRPGSPNVVDAAALARYAPENAARALAPAPAFASPGDSVNRRDDGQTHAQATPPTFVFGEYNFRELYAEALTFGAQLARRPPPYVELLRRARGNYEERGTLWRMPLLFAEPLQAQLLRDTLRGGLVTALLRYRCTQKTTQAARFAHELTLLAHFGVLRGAAAFYATCHRPWLGGKFAWPLRQFVGLVACTAVNLSRSGCWLAGCLLSAGLGFVMAGASAVQLSYTLLRLGRDTVDQLQIMVPHLLVSESRRLYASALSEFQRERAGDYLLRAIADAHARRGEAAPAWLTELLAARPPIDLDEARAELVWVHELLLTGQRDYEQLTLYLFGDRQTREHLLEEGRGAQAALRALVADHGAVRGSKLHGTALQRVGTTKPRQAGAAAPATPDVDQTDRLLTTLIEGGAYADDADDVTPLVPAGCEGAFADVPEVSRRMQLSIHSDSSNHFAVVDQAAGLPPATKAAYHDKLGLPLWQREELWQRDRGRLEARCRWGAAQAMPGIDLRLLPPAYWHRRGFEHWLEATLQRFAAAKLPSAQAFVDALGKTFPTPVDL